MMIACLPSSRWLMLLCLVSVLALPLCVVGSVSPRAAAAKGYFRVEKRDGVWWFIDPDGSPMLSIGADTIRYEGDQILQTKQHPYHEAVRKLYSNREAWQTATLSRLRSWGFNTVGAWSDPELWGQGMPYTVILDMAEHAGADWQHGRPADYFNSRFEKAAEETARRACAPRSGDRSLVGYFSDNELRWGPDWRGKQTMLQMYLQLDPGAPGRERATKFLRERYSNDVAKLNQAWNLKATDFEHLFLATADSAELAKSEAYRTDAMDFLGLVADRYFEVCARAIRAADPRHLYLGARFAGQPPDPVFRAARVADVVSINIYNPDPRSLAQHVVELTGRPVLITEFAFRAMDSGLPNSQGAGPKVPNQQARAEAYRDYVTRLESLPEAVGFHWFEWSDEPKEGRFDGENSNYGLVDINDRPYQVFVEAVKVANTAAVEAHRKAATPRGP